jgi:hypothetical protein
VVASGSLRQSGASKVAAATTGDRQDAPILNEDGAMMRVDQVLLEEEGSQHPVTRDQIRAAFLHLTDPLVGKAIWTDATHTAIVVTRLAPGTTRPSSRSTSSGASALAAFRSEAGDSAESVRR